MPLLSYHRPWLHGQVPKLTCYVTYNLFTGCWLGLHEELKVPLWCVASERWLAVPVSHLLLTWTGFTKLVSWVSYLTTQVLKVTKNFSHHVLLSNESISGIVLYKKGKAAMFFLKKNQGDWQTFFHYVNNARTNKKYQNFQLWVQYVCLRLPCKPSI